MPIVTHGKPISVFANEQLRKYEFCRMDNCALGMKWAGISLAIPFLVVGVVVAIGTPRNGLKPAENGIVKTPVKPNSPIYWDDLLEDGKVYPKVLDCRNERC